VFLDFNGDGTLNASDYGISGQVVNLTGTDINGNAVSAATTTAGEPLQLHRAAVRQLHGCATGAADGSTNGTTRPAAPAARLEPDRDHQPDRRDRLDRRQHRLGDNDFAELPGPGRT